MLLDSLLPVPTLRWQIRTSEPSLTREQRRGVGGDVVRPFRVRSLAQARRVGGGVASAWPQALAPDSRREPLRHLVS